MKKIGIIGGLSPESTAEYYLYLNQLTKKKFGGLNTPLVNISSVNQQVLFDLKAADKWHECGEILADAAQQLEQSGSDIIILSTNTMHKVADQIEQKINVPFLHIADATGKALKQAGLKKVGLLGTRYTMELPFYKERLADNFQIEAITPDEQTRVKIDNVIFNELCHGKIEAQSKGSFHQICSTLAAEGAEAIILGCTEIGLLIKQDETNIPLFDTATIHCDIAFDQATVHLGDT